MHKTSLQIIHFFRIFLKVENRHQSTTNDQYFFGATWSFSWFRRVFQRIHNPIIKNLKRQNRGDQYKDRYVSKIGVERRQDRGSVIEVANDRDCDFLTHLSSLMNFSSAKFGVILGTIWFKIIFGLIRITALIIFLKSHAYHWSPDRNRA